MGGATISPQFDLEFSGPSQTIAGSMASATTQRPQSTPPTPNEQPEQDFLLNALAWVELHRRHLLAGFAALIALYGVVYLYRHFAAQRELRANAALLDLRQRPGAPDSAPKAADFLKVAEAHASSTAGPRARLLAAGAYFSENKYSEAMAEFEKVLSGTGSGPVAAQAAYGIAACLDAQDKVDQALAKYQEIVSRYPDDSVAGQSKLAMARIQEGRQQGSAALRLYDDLLKDRDQGAFFQLASRQREELIKRQPELLGGSAGAPSTNAPAPASAAK